MIMTVTTRVVPIGFVSPASSIAAPKATHLTELHPVAHPLYQTLVAANCEHSTIRLIAKELTDLGSDKEKNKRNLSLIAAAVHRELEAHRYEPDVIKSIAESLKILSS